HGDVQPVGQSAAEVADVAEEPDARAGMVEKADRQAVARPGMGDVHGSGAALEELAQLLVQLASGQPVAVQRRGCYRVHARASPPGSSWVSKSTMSPNAPASAMPSLTTATQSSVSAIRQGLVEKRSRATPNPSGVETR